MGPPEPLAHYAFENTLDDSSGNFAAGTPTGDKATDPGGTVAFVQGVGGSETSWISVVPGGLGSDGSTMLWSGTAWYDAVTGVRVPTGEWTHFAAVNDEGNMTVYLDGVPMFTGSSFPDVFTPMVNPRFWIGVNHWDPAYNGLIDELEVFDIPLTDEDVARLYTDDPDG